MSLSQKRFAARRKLLGILPRSDVESFSGLERPWAEGRKDLTERCVVRWDSIFGEVEEAVERVFKKARSHD